MVKKLFSVLIIFFLLVLWCGCVSFDDQVPKGYSLNMFLTHQIKVYDALFISVDENGFYLMDADTNNPYNMSDWLNSSEYRVYQDDANQSKVLLFTFWTSAEGPTQWNNDGFITVENGIITGLPKYHNIYSFNEWAYNETLTTMFINGSTDGSVHYVYKGPLAFNLGNEYEPFSYRNDIYYTAYYTGNPTIADPVHIAKFGLVNESGFLVWFDV